MGSEADPFERVRTEPDPLLRARLAGDLLAVYQQRAAELAQIRKAAINQTAAERGMSFSAIAGELGLTRGRIAQIRQAASAGGTADSTGASADNETHRPGQPTVGESST